MSSIFFIRSAGEGDLAAVARLIEAREPDAPCSVQNLKADLGRPDSEFVLADNGRRIGGMGYAAMAAGETGIVILHRLVVDAEFEGQGLGRDLFAELETCFPDAKRMRVEIGRQDEAAKRFFAGLGFAEVDWAKNAADRPQASEVLIFEKELVF